ncbi:MAG: PAC2 family protein [Nanoarchaeota archaeon]|nr:PAC2 family protein [Nanoarchaeota archaeon]
MWELSQSVKRLPKLNDPILIEGLPGIGNVGKVAVDFIIDHLKAKKIYDLFSYTFPHSVFVNEDNLIELPVIEMYYKKMGAGKRDLLLLAGDVQPIDEVSSYKFSDTILDVVQQFGGKELVTLGGIGLQSIPKKPKVYCTGNSKDVIKKYKSDSNVQDNLYGVVGPIVGVSGLLLGLAKKREIDAVTLLAETFGHPIYLGIKGAKQILKILDSKLELDLDLNQLEKEIKEVEQAMLKRTDDINEATKRSVMNKIRRLGKDSNYIG